MTLAMPRSQVPDARWSVSLVEASRVQAKRKEEEERVKRWSAGNHDSTGFFRKMGQSLADTERYRSQCRALALASPSRLAEEKVSLEGAGRCVEVAKAFAGFSHCILPDGTALSVEATVDAPKGLQHLRDPQARQMRQQMEEAATKVQKIERGRKARKQVSEAGTSSQSRHESSQEHQTSQQLTVSEGSLLMPGESQECAPEVAREVSATSDGDDLAFGEDELSPVTPAITILQPELDAPSLAGSRRTSRRSSDEDSEAAEETALAGDDWPPKPPIVRFRAQMVFSKQFEGDAQKASRRASLEKADELKKLQGSDELVEDITLTWINMYFKLHVKTERQLCAGFPLIVLSMMDVIYPKKVRWHQVNWNTSYQRALHQNHRVLNKHWYEVNMDKVKDLRAAEVGDIESMLNANHLEKLAFLKQVKRWFDCRVLHSNAYNPVKRRTEIEKQIRLSGRWMKFPAWMEFDKEEINANRSQKIVKSPRRAGETTEFEKMPEFKRLLWFLGSSEHQTM